MPQMEFEVITDLTPVTSTKIDTNFAAIKAGLEEQLAPYASMIVSPDAIADAKKTRADIRKVGDSIDSLRKAVKKQWLRPYEEFEAQCKELTGIVGSAVSNIDGQIKAMEQEIKDAKKHSLEEFFAVNAQDVSDYISFDDVFDLRMLNSTYAQKDAEDEISRQLDEVRSDLTSIRSFKSPYEAAMLSHYARCHRLGEALAEGHRLEAIQKAEEERKAKELAETFAEEETPAEEAEEPYLHVYVPRKSFVPMTPEYPPMPQIVRPVEEEESPKPKLFTLRFEVTGTAEAFSALKRCMTANGMEYMKI